MNWIELTAEFESSWQHFTNCVSQHRNIQKNMRFRFVRKRTVFCVRSSVAIYGVVNEINICALNTQHRSVAQSVGGLFASCRKTKCDAIPCILIYNCIDSMHFVWLHTTRCDLTVWEKSAFSRWTHAIATAHTCCSNCPNNFVRIFFIINIFFVRPRKNQVIDFQISRKEKKNKRKKESKFEFDSVQK